MHIYIYIYIYTYCTKYRVLFVHINVRINITFPHEGMFINIATLMCKIKYLTYYILRSHPENHHSCLTYTFWKI